MTHEAESHFPLFYRFSFPLQSIAFSTAPQKCFSVPRAIHSHSVISARGSTQGTVIDQRPYMVTYCFRDTDDPTNIYGNSGKLRHILSATLTIQRTYMAIRENFVKFFPQH